MNKIQRLASLSSYFRKYAQEISRTDPVMDLIDQYKDKILQVAAQPAAGKNIRSADVFLNYDGKTTVFMVEATGPDAEAYNMEATNALNKNFKLLLNQATAMLKKERGAEAIKFRVLQDLEFSVQ